MHVYVDTEEPGITRRKIRDHWAYFAPDGQRITDRGEIDRLNKIALPPAYTDAWYCPDPAGHIQAVGYDVKGRKQYRYNLDFRAQQEAAKYDRCADFGRALPKLRKRVEDDLHGRAIAHDTVVAAVVRLLDIGRIRVGNESYAKENKSFGATTLRNRHAKVAQGKLSLSYRAKSGVMRRLTISDKSLLRVVRRVQDLPGQNLFQYVDSDGEVRPVGSHEVNDYIKDATGDAFTAKHFRTWSASVIALEHAVERMRSGEKWKLADLLVPVSEALGNTPTIARKSYVHPLVLALKDGALDVSRLPRPTKWLSTSERMLISLLEEAAAEISEGELDEAGEAA